MNIGSIFNQVNNAINNLTQNNGEQVQNTHDHDVRQNGDQGGDGNVQRAQMQGGAVDEGAGEEVGVGPPDHQRRVLQQVAHADGRDQHR